MSRRARSAVVAAGCAVLVVGCRAIVGIEDGPPTEASCGGYPYPTDASRACARESCCAEEMTCMRSPACALLAACERACPAREASCLRQCELERPDGVAAARDLGACLRDACDDTWHSPRWACLLPPLEEPKPTGGPPTLTYRVVDYRSLERLPGLTVKLCRERDPTCDDPIGTRETNGSGEALFLTADDNPFVGYAEIDGPGYPPVRVYLPAVTKDFVAFVGAVDATTFDFLRNKVKPDLEPDRTTILVNVVDCDGAAAAGVKLSIASAEGSVPFYLVHGFPDTDATATDAFEATGAFGGFVGVKGGTPTNIVRATAANGLAFMEARIYPRPGKDALTVVYLYAGTL